MGVFLAAGSSKLGLEKGEISDALATMIQLCAFARIRLQTPVELSIRTALECYGKRSWWGRTCRL
jgi:phage gp46-like protein